jgi:hypothetical protein
MALMAFNVEYSLTLTGIFRFECASQLEERYHGVLICALNMNDVISNNF